MMVHIYDDCEGLSAEELKTIFDPFRRGAHKGHTERGCHFWFTLPKARH